jgi:hypothetical protein
MVISSDTNTSGTHTQEGIWNMLIWDFNYVKLPAQHMTYVARKVDSYSYSSENILHFGDQLVVRP